MTPGSPPRAVGDHSSLETRGQEGDPSPEGTGNGGALGRSLETQGKRAAPKARSTQKSQLKILSITGLCPGKPSFRHYTPQSMTNLLKSYDFKNHLYVDDSQFTSLDPMSTLISRILHSIVYLIST